MRFGISVPNFEDYADPRAVAGLARLAEDAGWDGFFVWDHVTFVKRQLADAGATRWVEEFDLRRGEFEVTAARIRAGPPS